jgi:KAP family P-loop domain
MESKNQHIREFLSYYCKLTTPPEYAILITGLWGAGKTWFIQDVLNNLKQSDQESLYVSLYGVRSVEDIESEFFRQLHPFLAHKGVKLLGKLTKGLLRTAINFDLDGDGKSDGNVTFAVPSEKLIESVKIAENKILVFDDLERCAIPICDLLGYINQFVEHSGFKAILIANEKEIIDREEKNESELNAYKRIKEKLVGRTFEVLPELMPALQYFIGQLETDTGKKASEENQSLIAQIYESSGYKNLRLLRHALWDFDRLLSTFGSNIVTNKPLVSNLLILFLVFAFEIRSGNIFSNDIANIKNSYYLDIGNKNEKTNPHQKYINITKKYTGIDLRDSLFDSDIWENIFTSGIIPSAEIENALLKSKYFESENQPNWVRLWYGRDLSDSEFESVLFEVDSEWKEFKYSEINVVLQVYGLLLHYSNIGLYNQSHDEILKHGKDYVNQLKEQGNLRISRHRRSLYDLEAYSGLGFVAKDENAFKCLYDYLLKKQEEALIESYAVEASDLVKLMKDETDRFRRSLILSNHPDNKFYDIPIFTYISEEDFINAFLTLNPDQRKTVAYVFEERYKFEHHNAQLVSELEWLKKIEKLLQVEVGKRAGKMSAYTIGLVIDPYLKGAITKLESLQAIG